MTLGLFGDLIGFLGAGVILGAYAYQTLGGRAADLRYHLMNLVGAVLLAGSLLIHPNLASLCLETAWGAIALLGVVGQLRRRGDQEGTR